MSKNFNIFRFDKWDKITESNSEYFEIVWLINGKGVHKIDFKNHPYEGSVMLILSPGQIHVVKEERPSDGFVIRFLPSIFNLETEFFDFVLDTCLYESTTRCPMVKLSEFYQEIFRSIFFSLQKEFQEQGENTELIISSYLKILITHINRIKKQGIDSNILISDNQFILFRSFKVLIEKNYKKTHSVQGFASLLNVPARTLNSLTKKFANKTASELIQERVLLEAKRRLIHQPQSVKEICFNLGFEDPAYFTRFFKKHTGISPQYFKNSHF